MASANMASEALRSERMPWNLGISMKVVCVFHGLSRFHASLRFPRLCRDFSPRSPSLELFLSDFRYSEVRDKTV